MIFQETPYHQEGNNIAKANLERSGDKMIFKSNWSAPTLN